MSEFWNRCLEELRQRYAQEVFQNWFADLQADETGLESGSLTLIADSGAKARTLQTSYGAQIQTVINQTAGREIDITWEVSESEVKPAAAPFAAESAPAAVQTALQDTGLLPNLTFENIVEGKANQLAYAAAQQVANSTNAIYNPLFIYGGVGLGKTHLMQAIGHQYIKTQTFENRYQNLDLLLIDDIQSFASREGTQTNFFLAFERMVPHGKQIVLTSDTYPRNLKAFQERLLSRLTQGLVVSVEPPELDMRIQILLQKADRSGLEMPEEVAVIIAKRLKSNVRELEGAVQQILAYTNFHNLPVSVETAKVALRDVFNVSAVPVTVENIQQVVSEYYVLG